MPKVTQADLKPKENLMLIDFGYNTKIVLPYSEGVKIVTAMSGAEVFKDNYSEDKEIRPIEEGDFTVHIISHKYYADIKTAQLLGVPFSRYKQNLEKQKEEEPE